MQFITGKEVWNRGTNLVQKDACPLQGKEYGIYVKDEIYLTGI